MHTPKNHRVQTLDSASVSTESPFRRRSAMNVSTLSMPPPNSSPSLNQALNDDEAERRTSRRFDSSSIGNESMTNVAEEAASLNNCLKLFAENKINKDNAWNINIIDSFAKLISKHHHLLSNFQVAGQTLEASAKVYGLRVDSVYTDVCRMSADLARQSARALTKKGSRPNDDEEASDREQEKENDKENQNTTNQNDQQPKTKKIRKRKNISTITKNPDSLNGRLDTNPLTDPFFAKLNSVIGDTTSSKRLMQNIIPTADSKLKLRQNIPIWFSTDQEYGALDEDEEYTNEIALRKVVSSKPVFRRSIVPNTYVRLGLSTYRIVNTTLEQVDDNEGSFRSRYGDDLNHSEAQNSFHMELQFDINAEVAPVPHEKSIVMDYGEMDNEDFEDLNEVDLVAVGRCKGLRREPVIIEDMQPENSLSLEYSYRPLGIIDQFWAGPSHWKFRQSRRTGLSMGTRASHFTNHSTEQFGTAGQRNKVVRKRKIVKTLDVTVEDVCIIDNCIVEKNLVEKITPNMRGMQLTHQTIAKKWDSKKHKLPVDYKLPLDAFEKLSHASSIHVNSNRDATFTGDDDGTPYNYQNAHDRDYCSRVAESQSDTETETNTDMGQMDNNMEFDNNDLPPTPALIDEIPDVFEGAPERIEKINIAFARRAKVVDMKQLKLCSWTMINNKHLSDPLTYPKFSEILRELPKVLSRSMAENMSMPLAFYAVLHLCNDKGLLLNQNDAKLQDFVIEFVN